MVFLAQFSVWAAGGMFFARTFTGFFFVFRQVTRRVFEKILFFSVLLLFFRKIFKIISQILMPKSSCQKNLAQEQFSELFLMQFCNFCLSSAQNLLKAEQFRVEIDSWTARGKFFFLFVAVRLSVVKNIAQFVFLLTIWLLNYENFWVNRNLTTRNIELVLSQSYRLEIREWWFETIANRVLRSIFNIFPRNSCFSPSEPADETQHIVLDQILRSWKQKKTNDRTILEKLNIRYRDITVHDFKTQRMEHWAVLVSEREKFPTWVHKACGLFSFDGFVNQFKPFLIVTLELGIGW